MNAKVIQYWRSARDGYWFVPSLMVVAAVLLAFFTDWIDTRYGTEFLDDLPWMYKNQPEGARAVLSAVATSMIGVAGVTFSMTIVSVSFAAANLGPRLIGNFMRDTGNQITLGTFIATFVYCLSVLRTVTNATGSSDSAYVPNISLLVALFLTLASVAVLIYFIHHIPESINVSRIASIIGNELQRSVANLFAGQIGESSESQSSASAASDTEIFNGAKPVNCDQTGYLQGISTDKIMQLACEQNIVLRLEYRPGDFCVKGSVLAYAKCSTPLDDTFSEDLMGCFVFGTERTVSQNTLFLVDQLIEIMARALSPGVNDPYTAVSCIDWLQSAMTEFMRSEAPLRYRYDDKGNLRVVIHPVSFKRFAAAVFDQSLQYVAADRMAALHTMHMIAELVAIAERAEDRHVLLHHAHTLNEGGDQTLPLASARAELALRYAQTKKIAADPEYRRSLREDDGWLGGQA